MRRQRTFDCGECGQCIPSGIVYHPYLYCELYKMGHRDQEAYLRSYGFERVAESTSFKNEGE